MSMTKIPAALFAIGAILLGVLLFIPNGLVSIGSSLWKKSSGTEAPK